MLSTNDGKLFVYGTKNNLQLGRECSVYMPHCKNINKIKVTYDHKTLVTADEDGTIFVYKVTEGQNNRIGQYSKKISDLWEDNRLAQNQHGQLGHDAAVLQKPKAPAQSKESTIVIVPTDLNASKLSSIDKDSVDKKEEKRQEEDQSESEGSDNDVVERNRIKRVNRELYSDIDNQLSLIVLIEKSLMEEWRKQQEQLKLDLEKEENQFESQIRKERYNQDTQIATMERLKSE